MRWLRSSIARNPVESQETRPSSTVFLTSQRHPEKLPEVLSQMHLSNKLDVVKGPQMAGGHLQIAHPPGPRFPDLHSSTWTILLAVSLFDHN